MNYPVMEKAVLLLAKQNTQQYVDHNAWGLKMFCLLQQYSLLERLQNDFIGIQVKS